MSLKIQVYSDYVCPFCYLAEFPLRAAIRGRDVEVEWMPFELRPEPSPTLRPEGEYLQQTWARSVYPMAERMGVPIVLPDASPQPHTHLAFEGDQFAKGRDLGPAYNERVLDAFFREGRDIGDVAVLSELAGEVGLDRVEFDAALRLRDDREAHRSALRHASDEAKITGVPAFVIGGRVLAGVQDEATLDAAITDALNRP